MNEISLEELRRMPAASYELIDIRDEGLTLYGVIPNAISIPLTELEAEDCAGIEALGFGSADRCPSAQSGTPLDFV